MKLSQKVNHISLIEDLKDLFLSLHLCRDTSKTSAEKYKGDAIYGTVSLLSRDRCKDKKRPLRSWTRLMRLTFCESFIQSYGFIKHVRLSAFFVNVCTIQYKNNLLARSLACLCVHTSWIARNGSFRRRNLIALPSWTERWYGSEAVSLNLGSVSFEIPPVELFQSKPSVVQKKRQSPAVD